MSVDETEKRGGSATGTAGRPPTSPARSAPPEAQRRRGAGVGLCVRVVSAAVLIVIAVSATLLSWGPLRNVFADYQDSPLWVYLLFGLSWLAIACIAAAGAVFLLRRR